jgi:hypothetical protein
MKLSLVVAIHVVEASAQEATATRDSAAIHIKDAEDQAALVEREARERGLRVEVENLMVLASTREDAEDLVQKITLHEGELAKAHRAREVAEENSCGLSNTVNDD